MIYTIGHSNRRIEEFLAMLVAHEIEQLVDVRTAAGSQRNPQFGHQELAQTLNSQGMDYLRLPQLGGFRKTSPRSRNTGWHNDSFRGFADYMETAEFEQGILRLLELAGAKRTCITCSEAVPWRCHRSLIADALTVRGENVCHIMSTRKAGEHRLTPFSTVSGTDIWYPPDEGERTPAPTSEQEADDRDEC
jgi:uncharacterized protein (DUF488 family)